MSLGLTNARLGSAGARAKVEKVAPARTSIAEDAKFIPKPYKRVKYKVNAGFKPLGAKPADGGGGPDAIPLPGQKNVKPSDVSGGNIRQGSLGKYGLTASFGRSEWGGIVPKVEMVIDPTPEKDFSVIATQEEGRQTNRAAYTHYTQQYDAYGRPRIGFSREPYDFAAIKYIVKTSEIKFQENMDSTYEAYRTRYSPVAQEGAVSPEEIQLLGQDQQENYGMIDPGPEQPPLPGSDKVPQGKPELLGSENIPNGEITGSDPQDVKLKTISVEISTTFKINNYCFGKLQRKNSLA